MMNSQVLHLSNAVRGALQVYYVFASVTDMSQGAAVGVDFRECVSLGFNINEFGVLASLRFQFSANKDNAGIWGSLP